MSGYHRLGALVVDGDLEANAVVRRALRDRLVGTIRGVADMTVGLGSYGNLAQELPNDVPPLRRDPGSGGRVGCLAVAGLLRLLRAVDTDGSSSYGGHNLFESPGRAPLNKLG